MSLSIDSQALRMTGNNPIKQFVWTSDQLSSSHCKHSAEILPAVQTHCKHSAEILPAVQTHCKHSAEILPAVQTSIHTIHISDLFNVHRYKLAANQQWWHWYIRTLWSSQLLSARPPIQTKPVTVTLCVLFGIYNFYGAYHKWRHTLVPFCCVWLGRSRNAVVTSRDIIRNWRHCVRLVQVIPAWTSAVC